MPIVADAAVAIRGDLSKFSGDLKKAEGQTQSLGQKLQSALSPKNIALGLAGGFAASKVLGFFGDAIGAASDLGETVSKTGQIIGRESLPELERWAEGAAEAFGQSKQQALDGASTFAIFGKSAGLAGDDLVGFSTGLTELAGDLASFNNTSPEEAIQAIGAALRGEAEPIRRYGVLLDDATLRNRAFRMGIIATTKEALTPQQRVLAAQAEIMAQTADAQGDFARTSDGLANTQRQLEAEMANVSAEIGEKLLPIWLDLVNLFKDVGIPIIKGVAEVFGLLLTPIRLAVDAITWAKDTVGDFVDDVTGKMPAVPDAVDRAMAGSVSAIQEGTGELATAADAAAGGVEDEFKTHMDAAASHTAIAINKILGYIKDAEDPARQSGAAAVDAWSAPLLTSFQITELEAELASDDLAKALRSKDPEIKRDAEKRRVEIVAELIKLKNEQATQGDLMTQIARTDSLLQSQFMLNGIRSKDREIKNTFLAWKQSLEQRMAEMKGSAYTGGSAIAKGVAAGIMADAWRVARATGHTMGIVRSMFPSSEPKDPRSPLRGITRAFGMMDILAEGVRRDSGTVPAALTDALSGFSVGPNVALPTLGMAPMAPVAGAALPVGGNVTHINLTVEGEKPVVSTATEIAEQAARLGRFS